MTPKERAQLEDVMRGIAGAISAAAPDVGFALFMWRDWRPGGNVVYISNAERDGMCAALRDFLSKAAPQ